MLRSLRQEDIKGTDELSSGSSDLKVLSSYHEGLHISISLIKTRDVPTRHSEAGILLTPPINVLL